MTTRVAHTKALLEILAAWFQITEAQAAQVLSNSGIPSWEAFKEYVDLRARAIEKGEQSK